MAGILFELAHPKHYLQFRYPIRQLRSRHDVTIAARKKDVLFDLLAEDGEAFVPLSANRPGVARKVLGVPAVLSSLTTVLRRVRPSLIVSRSSPYAALLGRAFASATMVFPDSEGVPLNERFVVPLSRYVVTPAWFERDYGPKHFRVGGLFESGYLHPEYFRPNQSVLKALGVAEGERYAIVRFVRWSANHDAGNGGFSDDEKVVLVRQLERRMKVFVSAESSLPEPLAGNRFAIASSLMHDALSYASLYVGDSQSMATEAALLGTPAVRYNSFVAGRDFSNFRNLESRYHLLCNHATFDGCLSNAVALADDVNAKRAWTERRAHFFRGIGDVNVQTVDIIEQCLDGLSPAGSRTAR